MGGAAPHLSDWTLWSANGDHLPDHDQPGADFATVAARDSRREIRGGRSGAAECRRSDLADLIPDGVDPAVLRERPPQAACLTEPPNTGPQYVSFGRYR
jgi:hypothetical protein